MSPSQADRIGRLAINWSISQLAKSSSLSKKLANLLSASPAASSECQFNEFV